MEENTEITEDKLSKPWQFKKGYDPRRNYDGRPPETLNFKTKWLIFIDKIAKQNGITADEVDEQLLRVAYKQMQQGDYRYWKDIQDRVYGTAVNNTDLTSGGEPLSIIFDESFKNKIAQEPEEGSGGQSPVQNS